MAQYQPQGFMRLTPAVKHLLIINILLYAITYLLESKHILPMTYYLGLWGVNTPAFHWWQVVTYMFMHGNFSHLFFNMFALWMFGYVIEQTWGTRRFLIYYFVCGIGAGVVSMLLPGLHLTVGASGAIYGLLLAFGMLYPNEYIYLYFLMPIKAKWFVVGYAVIELLQGIFMSNDGVAHFAHLAGMFFGLILILYWRKHPFCRF